LIQVERRPIHAEWKSDDSATLCLIASHLTEEKMAKFEKVAPTAETPVAELDHTEKIKSQVLAKIGVPPRLDRVEVSQHHNCNYRVNIWQEPEPNKDMAITSSSRIRYSYYLRVSDTGEIIDSNPPMIKVGAVARTRSRRSRSDG
jgi:hypothetical protein